MAQAFTAIMRLLSKTIKGAHNAINADAQKLSRAPLLCAGYGERYALLRPMR